MFPAGSKAMDEGLQLYPLPKLARKLPLASNRSTVLLGEKQFPSTHQCGTYMFPAASKFTLLACPLEAPVKIRRKDPSELRHCTAPCKSGGVPSWSSATNTSPPVALTTVKLLALIAVPPGVVTL